MIRIDAIWLTTEPTDMRARTDTALARVVAIVGATQLRCAYPWRDSTYHRTRPLKLAAGSKSTKDNTMTSAFPTLDEAQEKRIAAVHGGFLYQHLFAVGCMLKAQAANVVQVVIERDEDVEIVLSNCRVYVQIKTRSNPLIPSDIDTAFERFEKLRLEHTEGRRQGKALFVVASNQPPGPKLTRSIATGDIADDVQFLYPGQPAPQELTCLPECWKDLKDAVEGCTKLASQVPHAMLIPDSLVWKLAGRVLAAATGSKALGGYAFDSEILPELFEQLLTQLQGFPAPLPGYRPQIDEPAFISDHRIRIVCGFSGAGKTSWCAHTAMHSPERCIYFNASETAGAAVTSSLLREIGGSLTDRPHEIREMFAPGASGVDGLNALDRYLQAQGMRPIVVIDNAHEIPAKDLQTVFANTANLRFIILCQPTGSTQEIEQLSGVRREVLLGWDLDTLTSEAAQLGAYGNVATMERLRQMTGGLPLYLQSASRLAAQDYGGDLDSLCDALDDQSTLDTTAQQIILTRVFAGLPEASQQVVSFLSMVDVVITTAELNTLMRDYKQMTPREVAGAIRSLRPLGILEVFGSQELKIHDAMRIVGASCLLEAPEDTVIRAKTVLKDFLHNSLVNEQNRHRFSLYVRTLVDVGETEIIIDLAGEEMFQEMGLGEIFGASLEAASSSLDLSAESRFWALDALIFMIRPPSDPHKILGYLACMAQLMSESQLSDRAVMSYHQKNMSWHGFQKNVSGVYESIERAKQSPLLSAGHLRILYYNAAVALWRSGENSKSEAIVSKVIQEYLDLLGISETWILGRAADKVAHFFEQSSADSDDVKHLADAFEMKSILMKERRTNPITFRLFAFKLYICISAYSSAVRLGLDAAQDMLDRHDFDAARGMLADTVLPLIRHAKLLDELNSARSFYAVILAYCSQFDAAEQEMARIEPYRGGFTEAQREEFDGQDALIKELRNTSLQIR